MRPQLNQLVNAWRDHGGWPRAAPLVLLLAACFPLVDASSYHLHVITLVFMYMALSM
jgi:hypothetical protein